MNFECHITVPQKDAELAQRVARMQGWKTSEIARDPLLGDDTFFYLTKHDRLYEDIYADMVFTARFLENEGITVLRKKIELIMLDTKTGVGL